MAFFCKNNKKNHLPPPLSLLTTLLLLSSSLSMKVHSLVLFPTFLLSQVSRAVPTWEDYSQQQQHHAPNNTLISDPEGNKLGAVASQSEICSNIGGDILKQGGNAADATVSFFFFFLSFFSFFLGWVVGRRGGREGGKRGRKMNADIFCC